MTIRAAIMNFVQRESVNFYLTNGIPRRLLTTVIGWFSRIEQPCVTALSLRIWGFFSDLDLSDAKLTHFRSMQACFTRELKPGARPIDSREDVLVSPCDAIIGAFGHVQNDQLVQVKGITYSLTELLGDAAHATAFRQGCYVTLRLTAGMYHRFHAPHDCRVESVSHFPGDTWNVNPVTLKRIAGIFCKNERAVIRTRLSATGDLVTLVPVAAILVAGIRLSFLDARHPSRVRGQSFLRCHATLLKGQEVGWFEHGSTIVMLVPEGFRPCSHIAQGSTIRMGRPLFELPARAIAPSLSSHAE